MTLLHAHAHVHAEITFGIFAEEVLLHSLIDVLKLLPILFLTYLLMEFIEHRASDKTVRFIERSGTLAPVVGAAAGLLPQCGFSVSAANLYTGRVISVETLIAVFLATFISTLSEYGSARAFERLEEDAGGILCRVQAPAGRGLQAPLLRRQPRQPHHHTRQGRRRLRHH